MCMERTMGALGGDGTLSLICGMDVDPRFAGCDRRMVGVAICSQTRCVNGAERLLRG